MGLRLIAVVCLVGAAFAGPFQRESEGHCATRCPKPSHERFHYEPGQKYVYDYEGVNYIKIAGQRKQKALIRGIAEIHVISKCDMILKLRNIRIEQKASREEISKLIRQLEVPIPFAFEDGKIEHICPSREESQQSLNIKRGILSTIINTMSRFDTPEMVKEVDSLGTCRTKYTVLHGSTVEKSKDLKSCTNRHTSVTSLITNPYESEHSDIHSLPIFPQETLTCEQEIDRKVIKHVTCTEAATVKPFKEQDSIIEFEGKIELRLRKVERRDSYLESEIDSNEQSPILYNHEEEHGVESYETKMEDLLRKMCEKNSGFIDATISRDFFDLVFYSKHLPYESLYKIYNSLESGQICSSKKILDVFVDSLPMAGSEGPIKLMVKLLVDKKIVGLKAKLWTVSLAFIRKPTDKALAAVANLLKEDKSASVLLGVSAMVSRYCQKSKCERSEAVKKIVSQLNNVIGRQCSYDDEKKLIAVLKAFGNMGYLGEAQPNILSCAKPSVHSIQVRLAAIDAFRRTDKMRPQEMMSWYSNPEEHYEVRIAALSSIIKNADMKQIQAIKRIAEREQHEQVAAYTATLIANVKKSSCPSKKPVRKLLRDVEFKSPNVSYWDNSKNIELSTFSDHLNVGGGFEADLIHNPQSKLPRSLYTRFDVDVFGKRMNVFEMGMRAEGLEELIKKALRQNELQKQRSSWNFLKSSKPQDQLQASIFLRTMDIEFFELSASDLTGVGQMLKVADVVNQISRERSVDFSHSFLFMNSKLIIPSVTGRSYSFGLTGSATVGLTASHKIDVVSLLSTPKNGDIHGRFKPSCNVEMAATVGIKSSTGRPDMKIVTVLHSESDIEARFQVKDGHLALASITMPSDDIVVAKISSNVVEINADLSETPALGGMQKKLDSCISQLEKPLGLSICGKWEVPRPFLDKKFPFVRGIGHIEFRIKKTDPQMSGYELRAEIPRYQTEVMKYLIALDTPGSRVPRRFSSELEVRKVSQGQKEFTVELNCPFKSASAKGSWTMRKDLIEGRAEMMCGSKRASFSASTQISESSSLKTFKPSLEISLARSRPIKMGGIVTMSKGRKQQISIDIKSNVPQRKPLAIKGTLMKEGQVRIAKDAEWKLSSDLVVDTPFTTAQIRSSMEKQAKQAHTLSSELKIDYKTESSPQHTIKLSQKFQQSASKISSSAEMEMTQFPSAKLILIWNMQGKIRETMKNDITLKYGRNLERTYINFLQSSQMSNNGPGECRVAIKAPQWNVDSELRVSHEIKRGSKIQVDADIRYHQQKHVKGLLSWEMPSQKPLKMKMKSQIELPNRKVFSYENEIEEISSKTYEGTSKVQWHPSKNAELKYKYQKLSERSTTKHELETTLRLSTRPSPIKNKVSILLGEESVGLDCRLNPGRSSEFFIKAHLNKKGTSYLNLKVPKVEGNMKVIRENNRKALDLDVKWNLSKRPRHIIASGDLSVGSMKKLEAQIQWDADRNAEQKIAFSYMIENNRRSSYSYTSNLKVTQLMNVEVTGSGDRSVMGRHETSIDVSALNYQSVGVVVKSNMEHGSIKSAIKFSKNKVEKAEISVQGSFQKNANEVHLTTSAAIKSFDNSFESKSWSSEHSLSHSDSSLTLESHMRLQWTSSKIYESELNYDFQPNLVLMKAFLHTPHILFEKQSIGFSFRRNGNFIVSSAAVELSNGKVISISQEIRVSGKHFSNTITVSSPFKTMKDAKVHLSFENESSKKSLLSYVDMNGIRKAEAEAKMVTSGKNFEIEGRLKTVWTSEVSAHVTVQRSSESVKYSANIMKGPSILFSTSASKEISNQNQLYALNANSFEKSLVDLKLSKIISEDSTKHILEAKGPFSPVTVAVEALKNDKDAMKFVLKACRESRRKICYQVKGYHKSGMKTNDNDYYRKVTLDIEKSHGQSQPQHLANVVFVLSMGKHDFREKVIVSLPNKKYGYEISAHKRQHDKDSCHMDAHIFLESRTIRVRSSALHNSDEMFMDFEVIPDASVPHRRLGLEMKNEKFPHTKEMAGHVQFIYPGMEKPLKLSGRIQTEGILPVKGKLELHYSPSSWKKVLTLEIIPEAEGRQAEKKSVLYKLYREDESLDASVKMVQKRSRTEDLYGYEYSFMTSKGQQSGGVSITLSEKRNGRPTTVEIAFTAPEVDLKVKGRTSWIENHPNEVGLTVMSKGRQVYEFTIKAADSCLVFEEGLEGSAFFKSQLCANKVENGMLKVIYVESFYKGHKCLEFSVNVDPKQTNIATIKIDWDKEDFRHAWKDMSAMESLLMESPLLRELLIEIKKDIAESRDTLKPIYEKIRRKISEMIREHTHQLKNLRHKDLKEIPRELWNIYQKLMPYEFVKTEVWRPIIGMISCMAHKYVDFAYEHVPEIIRFIWNETKEQFNNCLNRICTPGTFCHTFVETYKRGGIKECKLLMKEQIEKMKTAIRSNLPDFRAWIPDLRWIIPYGRDYIPDIRKILPDIRKLIEFVQARIPDFSYLTRALKRIEERLMDYIRHWREEIPRLVKSLKETTNKMMTPTWWATKGVETAEDIWKRIHDRISNEEWYREFLKHFVEFEKHARVQVAHAVDKLVEKIMEMIKRSNSVEDFEVLKSLLMQIRNGVLEAWGDKEAFVKNTVEPLRQAVLEDYPRKWIKERFTVQKFSPKEGDIQLQVHYPCQSKHIEIMSNAVRALKSKVLSQM